MVGIARNFDYAASITYSGAHPGWVQQACLEFFDASGQLLATSEWITLDRFPGSSTDPFPPATQPATTPATALPSELNINGLLYRRAA
jgi:hypothetical protein